MKKYTIYIGSNNDTGVLEYTKAFEVLEKYFDGYTYTFCKGVWHGKHENTLRVEICAEHVTGTLIKKLKSVLKQDSIMLYAGNGEVSFL